MSDSGSKGGRPDPARRDLSPTEYEAETFIGYSSPKRGPAADDATQPPASNLPPAEPGRPGAWGAPAPAQTEPAKAPEPNEDDDTGAIASDAVRTERDKSSGSLVDSWDHTPESGSGSVGNTGGGDPNTAATVAPRPRPSSSNFTNEGIKQSGRIGPYPIQGELGRGGMGVVYLAKDTRLNRDVAVKLLPDVFAEHADRAARFEREARLLATLNHPNIAAIYGLEEDGGHRFIVMEYIPGETLGDRIRNGPMPVDDALSVHAQIAEGLEAAHEKGVIHRDLKPGNVKITPDGVVKVLDFGLAKSSGPDAEEKEFNAPTGSLDNTQEGMILGTAGYMSPEQSRGRPLDKRTDVWSFGCVLYESLVGHPPFYADTVSDTIALILRTEPDWTALPADTPPRVVELLKRCFQKDPKRRLRDLGDARIELTDAHEAMSSIEVPAESVAAVREAEIAERRQQAVATVPWLVAGVSIAAAATSLALLFRGAPAVTAVAGTGNEVRFVSELAGLTVDFADGEGTAIAAGPDGSTFVVVGDAQGERQLYRRDLAEGDSFVPIQGTTDATSPFFDPSGRRVGFATSRELKIADVRDGVLAPIASLSSARFLGGTFVTDDDIVFGLASSEPGLYRVPRSGARPPARVTTPADGEVDHRWPSAVPGTSVVFYTAWSGDISSARIKVVDLADEDAEPLDLGLGTRPVFVPSSDAERGMVVFSQDGNLLARSFDVSSMQAGNRVSVGTQVLSFPASGAAQFDLSQAGTLVSVSGAVVAQERVIGSFDSAGGSTGELLRDSDIDGPPRADPSDVTRLAYVSSQGVSLLGSFGKRVLENTADASSVVWTPDGGSLAFVRTTGDSDMLLSIDVETGRTETILPSQPANSLSVAGWGSDESDLLCVRRNPGGQRDIISIDLDFPEPAGIAATGDDEFAPSVSPDGEFIAYTARRDGETRVWVARYDSPTTDRQSIDDASEPVWARTASGGRYTLFVRQRDQLKSVAVTGNANAFSVESPRSVLNADFMPAGSSLQTYDVIDNVGEPAFVIFESGGGDVGFQRLDVIANINRRLFGLAEEG